MNINIVLGVICLLAALLMLVAVNNSSKVGDSAFVVPEKGDDFGFDFEF
jgi:YbbR domain-containing protein